MMLKATLITAFACLAATAAPTPGRARAWCLDANDGKKLAARYTDLRGDFTEGKALAVLAQGFTEMSDSANVVAGKPPGSTTYASQQEFIDAGLAGLLPRPEALDVLDVLAVTCDTVTLRWSLRLAAAAANDGSDGPLPDVLGVSVLRAVMEEDDWRVGGVWTEFNSWAYLQGVEATHI
ncbi:hypothetical protein SAMD00023353_8700180 [Rosellinia necatrix]|uniref:NTF2-like domain-containing protein n=1 Tax=Rosellinia necatrix TaxID=77044 RepID=A0A1W2TVZ0_ROSNE|nr:hypothetical protein SAMD00023353_8700180 [Rosellinia necatrix]